MIEQGRGPGALSVGSAWSIAASTAPLRQAKIEADYGWTRHKCRGGPTLLVVDVAGILVGRAQKGDGDAFTQLVVERVDSLYATAERILRDASLAEDATQQALLNAWRKLPQLQDPDRFDAWLYKLLVNACNGLMRQQVAWHRKLHLVEAPPWAITDSALQLAQRDELERAFARLSGDHRAVVVLRFYLGWSPDEIAASLGVRAGTVSSRLHYALRALRAALAANERSAVDTTGKSA